MGKTLSTTDIVNQIILRCRIGIDTNFALDRANQAFRWICQKGSFVWEQRKTTLSITTGATTVDLPNTPPDAFDPGKPAYVSGPSGYAITLPYKDFETAFDYQQFYSATAQPGMYSAWSYYTNFSAGPPPIFKYTMILSPASAAPSGSFSLPFVYHALPVAQSMGTNLYFPTPDELDDMIVLLAEAEAKRIYNVVGWDLAQTNAEKYTMPLLDKYRSDKLLLKGLQDQQANTQESTAKRSE